MVICPAPFSLVGPTIPRRGRKRHQPGDGNPSTGGLHRAFRERERAQQRAAEARRAGNAARGEREHLARGAVQREKPHRAAFAPGILPHEHRAADAEESHVAVRERGVMDVDDGAAWNIRRHGVPLHAHGQLRGGRHVAGDGEEFIVETGNRRGRTRRRGRAVERDGARGLALHTAQRVEERVDGLPPGGAEGAVLFHEGALLRRRVAAHALEAAAVEIVWLDVQRVEDPEENLLLRRADARLIVADGGLRHPQLLCQLRSGQAKLLPPALKLFAKTHAASSLRQAPTDST